MNFQHYVTPLIILNTNLKVIAKAVEKHSFHWNFENKTHQPRTTSKTPYLGEKHSGEILLRGDHAVQCTACNQELLLSCWRTDWSTDNSVQCDLCPLSISMQCWDDDGPLQAQTWDICGTLRCGDQSAPLLLKKAGRVISR